MLDRLLEELTVHTPADTYTHIQSNQLQGSLDSHLQLPSSLILSEDWIDPIYVI